MKKNVCFISLVFLIVLPHYSLMHVNIGPTISTYEWAVVGAGFAGITALAVLLDNGINPSKVAWIDPEFNVGRVGKYYASVPGNINIKSLLYYVNNCPFLKDINSPALQTLYERPLDEYPLLQSIVEPLQDFTNNLRNKVVSIENNIISLKRVDKYWILRMPSKIVKAKKVILAIGAQPRRLNYDILEIPLDEALNKDKLPAYISPEDSIAVFGSMHSAMLILKHLSEHSVKQIVNFYLDDYFFGAPGLEGETAAWVKNVLEKELLSNVIRVKNTDENRNELLPSCTKAIYAIGYEQTKIAINGSTNVIFDENTGIIDKNVYGIGIAFPPTALCNGHKIAKNGLNAYLAYAKKLIPHWVNKDKACLNINNTEIPWI